MYTKTATIKIGLKMFTKSSAKKNALTFFELANKNIIKKRSGMPKNLAKNTDKIIYEL